MKGKLLAEWMLLLMNLSNNEFIHSPAEIEGLQPQTAFDVFNKNILTESDDWSTFSNKKTLKFFNKLTQLTPNEMDWFYDLAHIPIFVNINGNDFEELVDSFDELICLTKDLGVSLPKKPIFAPSYWGLGRNWLACSLFALKYAGNNPEQAALLTSLPSLEIMERAKKTGFLLFHKNMDLAPTEENILDNIVTRENILSAEEPSSVGSGFGFRSLLLRFIGRQINRLPYSAYSSFLDDIDKFATLTSTRPLFPNHERGMIAKAGVLASTTETGSGSLGAFLTWTKQAKQTCSPQVFNSILNCYFNNPDQTNLDQMMRLYQAAIEFNTEQSVVDKIIEMV